LFRKNLIILKNQFNQNKTTYIIRRKNMQQIENQKILVTGGAGFIGSNLCEHLLECNNKVVCLDNFATGRTQNIQHLLENPNFTLIVGDIRNLANCHKAAQGVDYILHEAALGSVPRSINDPITSNDVNVSGFLNMLVAARDAKVKRFIYAASSSTYGDSEALPKVEDTIGKPLSPYAITKYVNELYADIFHRTYGLDTIGLRYFNVFGRKQDPDGSYAAVIPKFVMQLMNQESPVINGDGNYSRDFTYIDNVIQMNVLAMLTENPEAINTVYNTAFGDRTTLNDLMASLKKYLSIFDPAIADIQTIYGPNRAGDIPHSLASIDKAKKLLGYNPEFSMQQGLEQAVNWYWENLK
jgi:UDP-N-acetylglucosamine 4-epimerase